MDDFRGVLFAFLIVGVAVCAAGIALIVFIKHKVMRWVGGFVVAAGALFVIFVLMIFLSDLRVR